MKDSTPPANLPFPATAGAACIGTIGPSGLHTSAIADVIPTFAMTGALESGRAGNPAAVANPETGTRVRTSAVVGRGRLRPIRFTRLFAMVIRQLRGRIWPVAGGERAGLERDDEDGARC